MLGENTAVLINGCHLDAELEGRGWADLTFGGKDHLSLEGRVTMGLKVAVDCMADCLILGTGASILAGIREAEVTYNEIVRRRAEIIDFLQLASSEERILDSLLQNVVLDIVSTNTNEEVASALTTCLDQDLDSLMVVSSSFHTMRALAIAIDSAQQLVQSGKRRIDIFAVPAYGTTMETAISEPPHRGDRPKTPIHRLVRRVDRLGRGQKAKEFFPALKDFVESWE